ncbi:MAG: hypothetical protein ACE5JS_20500 [Nitrospinota bacterium]
MTASLDVVAQANHWHHYAHYVSVALPPVPRRKGRLVFEELLAWKGIGLLSVGFDSVSERVAPRLHRRIIEHRLAAVLSEEHRIYAKAGNSLNRYWTPFKATCDEVLRVVRQRPGLTMKELLPRIRHHYCSVASARNALSVWIREGKIQGVEARLEGGNLRIFPTAKV